MHRPRRAAASAAATAVLATLVSLVPADSDGGRAASGPPPLWLAPDEAPAVRPSHNAAWPPRQPADAPHGSAHPRLSAAHRLPDPPRPQRRRPPPAEDRLRCPLRAVASSARYAGRGSPATRSPNGLPASSATGGPEPIGHVRPTAGARPSSSASSGFPCVASNSRRNVRGAQGRRRHCDSSRRVAPRPSGPTSIRCTSRAQVALQPGSGAGSSGQQEPDALPPGRRAANPSTSADAASSHGTSSTAMSSSPLAASERSTFKNPAATQNVPAVHR